MPTTHLVFLTAYLDKTVGFAERRSLHWTSVRTEYFSVASWLVACGYTGLLHVLCALGVLDTYTAKAAVTTWTAEWKEQRRQTNIAWGTTGPWQTAFN